jgi:hypothetical protein
VKTVNFRTLPDYICLKIAAKSRPLVYNSLFGKAVCLPGSLEALRALWQLTLGIGITSLLLYTSLTALPLTFILPVELSILLTGKLQLEYSVFTLFPGA